MGGLKTKPSQDTMRTLSTRKGPAKERKEKHGLDPGDFERNGKWIFNRPVSSDTWIGSAIAVGRSKCLQILDSNF